MFLAVLIFILGITELLRRMLISKHPKGIHIYKRRSIENIKDIGGYTVQW